MAAAPDDESTTGPPAAPRHRRARLTERARAGGRRLALADPALQAGSALTSAVVALGGAAPWVPRPGRPVKVHGPLRSGTNYLTALLERNLRVPVLRPTELGWKHGPLERHPGVCHVVLVRDPRRWLPSFQTWERIHARTPFGAPQDLMAFATAPLSHPAFADAWRATDPLDAWNRSVAGWLRSVDDGDALVLRYEDVLADLVGPLAQVAAASGARHRHNPPQAITERADTWATPLARDPLATAAAPGGRSALPDDVLELLEARLDPALLARLGYPLR